MTIQPKMSDQQAQFLWKNMSLSEQIKFKEMWNKLNRGDLMLAHVNVDDNEVIQNIVLEPKDKKSNPIEPFAKHFK